MQERGAENRPVHRSSRGRQFRRALPGGRHRRLIHRENRRHITWLRSGPAIRTENRAPACCPGSSRLQRTRLQALVRSGGSLDRAPGRDLTADLRARGHRDESSWRLLLREVLPRRFADRWLETYPLAGNSDRAFSDAEHQLHAWEVKPEGSEGYGKAEVTAGGVDTGELSARTMESKKVPGLFFIGEVVDVTGQLGGFNFQ